MKRRITRAMGVGTSAGRWRAIVACLASLGALTLTACSAGSTAGSGITDARYQALSDLGYRMEWSSYAVVPRRRTVRFFRAYDDIVVAHESGNSITVLEADTGQQRWNIKLDNALAKFVGFGRRGNGDLVDVSETKAYILDDQSGVLKERQRLGVLANTQPIMVNNILVVGSLSGTVLGHNLATGYKQWAYKLTGPIRSDPVRAGRGTAVVDDFGSVFILNTLTGDSIGRSRMYDGLANRMVAANGLVYAASRDQSIWAFPSNGGEARWRVRTEYKLEAQPAVYKDRVYLTLPGQGLTAFDGATGKRLWAISQVGGDVVAVRAGRLVVWDGSTAWLVDPQRGDVVASTRIQGASMLVPDAFVDGNLYVVEKRGRIQKFSPR